MPLLSSGNQRSKEEERKIHQVKKFRTCSSSFPFVQGWFQFPTELMLTNLPLSHFALYWLWCELAPWQITWSNRDPRGINSIQTANCSFCTFRQSIFVPNSLSYLHTIHIYFFSRWPKWKTGLLHFFSSNVKFLNVSLSYPVLSCPVLT